MTNFYKKTGLLFLLIVFGTVEYSCEEKLITFNIDCDECYTDQPELAELKVEISKEYINDSIGLPYAVYEGELEQNKIVFVDTIKVTDTLDYNVFYLYFDLDKYYSIKMNYLTKDNKWFMVVDGCKPKVKHVYEECYEPCWVTVDNDIDLTVSYPSYFDN